MQIVNSFEKNKQTNKQNKNKQTNLWLDFVVVFSPH